MFSKKHKYFEAIKFSSSGFDSRFLLKQTGRSDTTILITSTVIQVNSAFHGFSEVSSFSYLSAADAWKYRSPIKHKAWFFETSNP